MRQARFSIVKSFDQRSEAQQRFDQKWKTMKNYSCMNRLSPTSFSQPLPWHYHQEPLFRIVSMLRCLMSWILQSTPPKLFFQTYPPSFLNTQIASPEYCEDKSREEIIEGSSEEKMRAVYARTERASIYHTATIGDIPPEVLRRAFIYLLPGDTNLVAPSRTCRAFRPVALQLLYSTKRFGQELELERFVCGGQISRLIEPKSVKIRNLSLDMEFIGVEYTKLLARFVAPTLSILRLDFEVTSTRSSIPVIEGYAILEVILKCPWLYFYTFLIILSRHLILKKFNFGDTGEVSDTSPSISEGFKHITHLDLLHSAGKLRKFVEKTPMPKLTALKYLSLREPGKDRKIIAAIAENYPSLKSLDLSARFQSTTSLHQIVKYCLGLESFSFRILGGIVNLQLDYADIEALASFPRLKSLDIRFCTIEEGADVALGSARKLNRLGIGWKESLGSVFEVIGGNLASLDLRSANAESSREIAEHCQNLRHLQLYGSSSDLQYRASISELKKSLKRIVSLRVNYKPVRLGTDWKGYKDEG